MTPTRRLLAPALLAVAACNSVLGIPEAQRREDAGADAGACAQGQKTCAGACVSVLDPATGCSAPACTPCAFAHAAAACVMGACAIQSCELGFADCNGKPNDGCEVDVRSDPANCGDCNQACASMFACQQKTCGCTTNASCGATGTCDQGGCTCNGNACSPGSPCNDTGDCAF